MGGDKVKREGMRERGQSLVVALVTTRREIDSDVFLEDFSASHLPIWLSLAFQFLVLPAPGTVWDP